MKKEKFIKDLEKYAEKYDSYINQKREIETNYDLKFESRKRMSFELTNEFKNFSNKTGINLSNQLDKVLEEYNQETIKKAKKYASDSGHQSFINNAISLIKNGKVTEREMQMIEQTVSDDYFAIKLINDSIPLNSNIKPLKLPPLSKVEFIIDSLKRTITHYITRFSKGTMKGAIKYCIDEINKNFDDDFKFIDPEQNTQKNMINYDIDIFEEEEE